ncbi:MAG: lysylphosphatidylglycerol synthase domain-containing protein, partial [Anaerolineae bacterium]
MKRWRIGLLGVLVSGLATLFIISQFDAAEFLRALSAARWVYVLLCGLLLLLALLPRAKRWQVLLGGALPYWRTFHIMNVAYLVNNVLPLRIGEVARMYLAT